MSRVESEMNEARRPYVICHMVPSIDGRIVTSRWKLPPGITAEYERTAGTFGADAWMIGRVSMEPYAGKAKEEQVVTILTEQVPDDYLAFLQSKGVSYLFGGKREVNLKRVLEKLRKELGIEKLLLEGGGKIDGSFLAANLIDELSVLVAPVADGSRSSSPTRSAKATCSGFATG